MDTVKFIEERNRMCKSFYAACHDAKLQRCPAFKVIKNELLCAVGRESTLDATAQIAIVEAWSAAHPRKTRKTRQDVFLERYPDILIFKYFLFCPQKVNRRYKPEKGCDCTECTDCSREFWMQEVE